MSCYLCGYSIGHAQWCQAQKGTAVRAADCVAEYMSNEFVEQLRRDKAKLIQDLSAERRRREEAEAERNRYREALEEIAKQKRSQEMEDDEREDGDFEWAHDECVRVARAALQPGKEGGE